MMEKRNTLLLTIIAMATLMVAITGAAFAYFASQINTENKIGVNVNTGGGKAIFTATSSGDINIAVESYMMQQHDVDESNINTSGNENIAPLLTNTANINVALQSSEEGKVTTCNYDIVYTWNEGISGNNFGSNDDGVLTKAQTTFTNKDDINPTKYYVRSADSITEGFKELTIQVTSYTYTKGSESPVSHAELEEVNIDKFKPDETNHKMKLFSDSISSDTTAAQNHIQYDFVIKFYNLSIDQTRLMGKKFAGTIGIENVRC